MHRLAVAVCVLGLTAGCLGVGGADQSPQATTAAPADGSACDAVNVPPLEANDTGPYPTPPANLTASAAEDYARAFEQTLAYNRVYDSSYDRIHVRPGHSGTERTDDALIVQPLVRNDSSWQRFTSGGLATVRLLTGRFPGGQVECLRASLRMPVGDSRIDNFSRGNLASAVDLDTGQLGPAVSKYPLPIGHSFPKHPDTEARIAGVPLSEWPSVRKSALRLHERLKIPVLGLDVALTPRGVRVVEANPFYGRSSLEIPHGTSLSTTRFADVVRAWISVPDGESKSAARMPQHQSTMDTATSIP